MAPVTPPKRIDVGVNCGFMQVWGTQKWRRFDLGSLLKKGDHDLVALSWRTGTAIFALTL